MVVYNKSKKRVATFYSSEAKKNVVVDLDNTASWAGRVFQLEALKGMMAGGSIPQSAQASVGFPETLFGDYFMYGSYVQAAFGAYTNAAEGGGDGGHGWKTVVEVTAEGGSFSFFFNDKEWTGDAFKLRVEFLGCDEANFLATMFELLGASLRAGISHNTFEYDEGDTPHRLHADEARYRGMHRRMLRSLELMDVQLLDAVWKRVFWEYREADLDRDEHYLPPEPRPEGEYLCKECGGLVVGWAEEAVHLHRHCCRLGELMQKAGFNVEWGRQPRDDEDYCDDHDDGE